MTTDVVSVTPATDKKSKRLKSKRQRNRSPENILANHFLKDAFRPVKRQLVLACLCDVISVIVLVVQAWILASIIADWLAPFVGAGALGYVGKSLWVMLAVLFGCLVLRSAIAYGRDYLLTQAGLSVAKAVRGRLLAKLGEMGLARRYFGADGALASTVIDEPEHLMGYARFSVQKITAVLTPIILAVCIAVYSKMAAMILLMTAPLVPIFMMLIGVATARKSREQMDALAQLGGRFLDWIRGVNTLSRLGAVDIAISDIEVSSETYRKRTMDVLKIAFLNTAVLEFLSALSIALVAVYLGFGLMGILPWANGEIITTYFAALFILLLVPEFYAPLRRLGAEYHIKGQASAAAKAIAPMLGFKVEYAATPMFELTDAPNIHLNQVSVSGDDGRVRLPMTTLSFAAGKRTALMGASGAGKSTILQVLLGFGAFDGQIVIQAGERTADYCQIDVATVRPYFGYLSQSAPLLPLSIRENLCLAKPTATDAELIQVLETVGMWQIISALPDGIDTKLSERGGGLSGGQAQRLAIAQLLLQDAKVWLLDEPTEHLDDETATHIKDVLYRTSAGKTVIWVTHDHRTQMFDAIHVIGECRETTV